MLIGKGSLFRSITSSTDCTTCIQSIWLGHYDILTHAWSLAGRRAPRDGLDAGHQRLHQTAAVRHAVVGRLTRHLTQLGLKIK